LGIGLLDRLPEFEVVGITPFVLKGLLGLRRLDCLTGITVAACGISGRRHGTPRHVMHLHDSGCTCPGHFPKARAGAGSLALQRQAHQLVELDYQGNVVR